MRPKENLWDQKASSMGPKGHLYGAKRQLLWGEKATSMGTKRHHLWEQKGTFMEAKTITPTELNNKGHLINNNKKMFFFRLITHKTLIFYPSLHFPPPLSAAREK